jgi:hypothetical protein
MGWKKSGKWYGPGGMCEMLPVGLGATCAYGINTLLSHTGIDFVGCLPLLANYVPGRT